MLIYLASGKNLADSNRSYINLKLVVNEPFCWKSWYKYYEKAPLIKKENLVCGIRIVNYSFFIECAFVDATGIDI